MAMTLPSSRAPALSSTAVAVLLSLITAIGFLLRMKGIGQDLWIDEIASLENIRGLTASQILLGYKSTNQHTLNSLLLSASMRLFGESEWSLRLTAVLFGAATVPVMYWVARLARFDRAMALLGALALALSYHHIWFSQNARGYTGYILFSLLATGALVCLLESPRRRWTVLFVVASALNFLALLPSVFVFAAQVTAAAAVLWLARRRGVPDRARVRRVATAFGLASALAAIIFTPIAREMLRVLSQDTPKQNAGYALYSLSFLREVVAGLLPNSTPLWLILAVVPAGIAIAGLVLLLRRAPVIGGVLLGAHVIFAAAISVLGWPVYPRLFTLGLPLALLALVIVVETAPQLLPARWRRAGVLPGRAVLAAALVLGFSLMLPPLYRAPKQPYRAALAEASRLSGRDDFVVVVGVADRGIRYYKRREPDLGPAHLGYARTVEKLEEEVGGRPRDRVILLTMLHDVLRKDNPELWDVMQRDWQPAVTLRGTLRGGNLTLWMSKARAEGLAAPSSPNQ